MRVKSKTFGKQFTDDGGLTITVAVDAELDTDIAAELLNELRQAKASFMRTIRQGCKLERDEKFDDALKSFDAAT